MMVTPMPPRHLSEIVLHQNPLCCPPGMSVQEACGRMQQRRVGAVLVVGDDGALTGIFTGRDAVGRVVAAGKAPGQTSLAEVMTPTPDTMQKGSDAVEALRMMQDGGYRHIPVVADGKVVGIVSRGDFRGAELDRLDEETGLWERI